MYFFASIIQFSERKKVDKVLQSYKYFEKALQSLKNLTNINRTCTAIQRDAQGKSFKFTFRNPKNSKGVSYKNNFFIKARVSV